MNNVCCWIRYPKRNIYFVRTFQLDRIDSSLYHPGLSIRLEIFLYILHEYLKWIIAPIYNVNYCSFGHAYINISNIKVHPADRAIKRVCVFACMNIFEIFFTINTFSVSKKNASSMNIALNFHRWRQNNLCNTLLVYVSLYLYCFNEYYNIQRRDHVIKIHFFVVYKLTTFFDVFRHMKLYFKIHFIFCWIPVLYK